MSRVVHQRAQARRDLVEAIAYARDIASILEDDLGIPAGDEETP